MSHTANYSIGEGTAELTFVTDPYEIVISTNAGTLCVISKEERTNFLEEIRAVIQKYAI
jgi:hypothetical protein